MSSYRFLSPAEEEMTEAALFYESRVNGLGSDFLDDVQHAIDRLSEYPHSGELIDSSLRRALLHRFPFSLIYAVERESIVVIAVAHHGRVPEYWRSRIS
jgi:plasmid stabilization system protein ParE